MKSYKSKLRVILLSVIVIVTLILNVYMICDFNEETRIDKKDQAELVLERR